MISNILIESTASVLPLLISSLFFTFYSSGYLYMYMYNVYICNMFMQSLMALPTLQKTFEFVCVYMPVLELHFLPLILLIDLNHHFWEKISLSLDFRKLWNVLWWAITFDVGNGEVASVALFYLINQIKVSFKVGNNTTT